MPSAQYPAMMFAIITLMVVYRNPASRKKVVELLHNKVFMGGLMMVVLWSFFSLRGNAKSEEDKKSREATKSAIIALIIAIMSELHLSIAPFWLVWIAAYYLDAH
jgi:transposase